jgi:hypothetical protein
MRNRIRIFDKVDKKEKELFYNSSKDIHFDYAIEKVHFIINYIILKQQFI